MKHKLELRKLTMTALMAAVIFVVTYLIRIPMPVASGGYINIGDTMIYIAAFLLGGPGGMIAGAAGSALADLSAGYVWYILPTIVVKGLMGFVCGKMMRQAGFLRFLMTSILGGAIMVVGYASFETVLFNINLALAAIPFNLIQWVCSVAAAAALFPALTRIEKSLGK